jgi:hypothetical protein
MLALGAIVSGCGSSAPAHSAPQACKDFASWWLAQGGNVLAGKDKALLTDAVHTAPSGQLYHDMSTLQANVASSAAAQGTALATGEKSLTIDTAYAVEQDCQSVNTSS